MPQHLGLDRLAAISYLGLVVACASPAPEGPVPEVLPAVSRSEAAQWASRTVPDGHRVLRFRWLFNDGQASVGGMGTARIAGPDSLRFDIAGPLGIGNAAAMVVGDAPRWVAPPEIIARLIPSYPLMWALFGVIRPPPPGADVRGTADATSTSIQWAQGGDTVRYLRHQAEGGALEATWKRADLVMGVVETRLDARGAPVSARLTVPSVPARLDLTIVVDSAATAFPASTWAPPPR